VPAEILGYLKAMTNKTCYFNTKIESVEKGADDGGELVIKGYANTTDEDRAGDVIRSDAWAGEGMKNYLLNPIILAFHNHSKPIGTMIEHQVTDKGLEITARISKGAGDIYELIKDGILKSFSVGFRINDAEYNEHLDLFIIKALELLEISVVSVPCNQTSIFNVSKDVEGNAEDITELKTKFATKKLEGVPNPSKSTEEELDTMTPEEIAAAQALQVKEAVAAALKAQDDAQKAEKAKKEAKAAEDQRIVALVKSGAEGLVAEMAKAHAESTEAFDTSVKELREELKAKSDEIAAIRTEKANFHGKGTGTALTAEQEAEVCDAVMLSKMFNKDVLNTKAGEKLVEKLNTSSSYEVSSEGFETVFSNNMQRDIQDLLVVAPLFREINMNSRVMTLPIRPDAASATWVAAAAEGTSSSSGSEIAIANTEVDLVCQKLAAKAYLTDETDEDVLQVMMPFIRDALVEAHAETLDLGLINGNGVGANPTGLISVSAAAGAHLAHTKVFNSATRVTARDLIDLRSTMGQRALKLNNLALIVDLETYWDLLRDTAFETLDEVGSLATRVTGKVGRLHGMDVLVSTQFPTAASTSTFALLVDKTNFVMPRQRGLRVQTDYDIETQRRVIVSTERVGFSALIGTSGVATYGYAV